MLGEDTLVFTKKGFKKVKDLILFDEVLTPFGDFEPIVEMSEWEEMTNKVILSTCEEIYCTDNLLWHLNGSNKYTDELVEDTSTCGVKFALEGVDDELDYSPYDYAVVVPEDVPIEIMMGSLNTKLEFLAGLIDSPICELGTSEGIYKLYIREKYSKLADEILAFIRSLSISGIKTLDKGVFCITINITKYIDILPIRDEMKLCDNYANNSRNVMIRKIEELSNNDKIMGRMLKVNKGFFLVGYSLVPVC